MTPEALAVVGSGALLGAASIPHCVGMCGGIAGACSQSAASGLTYQLARLCTYAGLGAGASLALGALRSLLPSGAWSWAFAGVTAAALVFSALRLLRMREVRPGFVPASALGRKKRRAGALMPLGLGVVTGFLPCGALYGALGVSATAGSPAMGALTMGAFGLASSAGLWLSLPIASFLARGRMRRGREALAFALLAGAVVVLLRPLLAAPEGGADCHASAPRQEAPQAALTLGGAR